jgi:hypothetical protein
MGCVNDAAHAVVASVLAARWQLRLTVSPGNRLVMRTTREGSHHTKNCDAGDPLIETAF